MGSGAYGHVWQARNKSTGAIVALKKVFSAFQNSTDAQRTYREICILNKVRHPNVICLREVIASANDIDIYLVFEFMQSDLFNAIRDAVLKDRHKKFIIYQLASALEHLHSVGVIHRDVKPSNVLLNDNCEVKLCDFGLSRSMNPPALMT